MIFTERVVWAERIKALRARLGITQHELAVDLGLHDLVVSRWERAQHGPNEEHRRKLERLEAAGTKGEHHG